VRAYVRLCVLDTYDPGFVAAFTFGGHEACTTDSSEVSFLNASYMSRANSRIFSGEISFTLMCSCI